MKVFVSFDGDHIGRMVGRASLADQPEEVSRIAQAIERGNQIWQSWAESHGGKIINIGGDEGRLEVEADHLGELPKIREQYEGAVGSTVSVGVGTRLSEADKSLMAAKLQGGNRIQLYTEQVNELLEELREKPEGEKLYDEYLNPDSGLQKAQPGMNPGANAGFSGASRSHPAAPQSEASEHSEAEVARSTYGVQQPQPGQPVDYEQMFHQVASQTPADEPQQPTGLQDDVRAKIVQVLQDIRGKADKLEEMRAQSPDLYNSVKGLVEAMIAMAQAQNGDQGQPVQKAEKLGQCKWKLGERRCQRQIYGDFCHDHVGHWANKIKTREDLDKAALEAGKTGRHQVVLPVGSQVDPGPSANHEGGEIKVRDPESGKTKWRQVRSGLVMAPDGTPTSSRNPGG